MGSINIRPRKHRCVAALIDEPTFVIVLVAGSNSKNVDGGENDAGVVTGPALKNTLPFGSRQAGPSTAPRGSVGVLRGMVGPDAHVPAWLAIGGDV